MKINYASYSEFIEIQSLSFDYIICSSGYETRSNYFYSQYKKFETNEPIKICFSFRERKVLSKDSNDAFFFDNGFKMVDYDHLELEEAIKLFNKEITLESEKPLNILVDYSCMTKTMYAALIKYFSLCNLDIPSVSIYFSYTQALFSEPPVVQSNLHNEPIPLYPWVGLTDKKIALITNLGYEKGRAQGLIEYLQISLKDIYLFLTSSDFESPYSNKIRENNEYILAKIPEDNQFEFDIQNTTQIFNLLESISIYLISKSYRVVIAPLGPKVFSLIALLLTLKYNDITVFRVSDGIKGEPIDRIPDTNRNFIILKANFLNESFQFAQPELYDVMRSS